MGKLTVSCLAVAAAAGVAAADTVNLQFVDTGAGRNIRASLDGSALNVFAGQLEHRATEGQGPQLAAMNGETLLTFCTDFEQNVARNGDEYRVVDVATLPDPDSSTTIGGMGDIRAAAIQSLYAYSNSMGGEHSDENASNNFAAAFQIAVWEIVYDYDGTAGSLDVTDGAFTAARTNGSGLWSGVQTILTDIFNIGVTFNTNANNVLGLSSGFSQDQLIETTTVVPTPAAAGFGLLGLGALAARRRR